MADSNITKRALSVALKALMEEQSFSKINVRDICQRCNMSRKSFYYHFRDKYDLVNWIFDSEFCVALKHKSLQDGWGFLEELCRYLYENREFYRKAIQIQGQNSFSEHFHEVLFSAVTGYICETITVSSRELSGQLSSDTIQHFYVCFITDGIICAIERWFREADSICVEDFLKLLRSCITNMAVQVYQQIESEEHTATKNTYPPCCIE